MLSGTEIFFVYDHLKRLSYGAICLADSFEFTMCDYIRLKCSDKNEEL